MADIFKKIDTIGWLFAAFVVVVTAIAAMVTVSHVVGPVG